MRRRKNREGCPSTQGSPISWSSAKKRFTFLVSSPSILDATWTTIHLAHAAAKEGHAVRFAEPHAFELTATSIELGVPDDPSNFALPDLAMTAKVVPGPESLVNASNFFDLLERRDATALSVVLTPGLRLPDPKQLDGAFAPPQ